jgi:RecA/RadA recombinase
VEEYGMAKKKPEELTANPEAEAQEGGPKKKNSFADILKISKKGLGGTLQNNLCVVRGRIPRTLGTGSLFLDFQLNGGLLAGKFYHMFGPSGGGKSTATYRHFAANQRVALDLLATNMASLPNYLPNSDFGEIAWRPIILCDAEGGMNESFLQGCGVDFTNNPHFTVIYPDTGEDYFNLYKRICVGWWQEHLDSKGNVDPHYIAPLNAIDSLSALIPSSMLDDEQKQIAYLARLLSDYIPLNVATNMKSGSTTVAINQTRINPMQMFGNPERTKGGDAPYFFSSANIRISRTGKDEEIANEMEAGKAYNLKYSVKKCRFAPAFKDYEIQSIMGRGFSIMSDMWNFATASGQLRTAETRGWFQLHVIGREDLSIKKNARADDIMQHMRNNNLWEVFVKQVFSGAAWGYQMEKWQLDMIGNVDPNDVPIEIIDPVQEADLMRLAEQAKAEGSFGDDQSMMPATPSMPSN